MDKINYMVGKLILHYHIIEKLGSPNEINDLIKLEEITPKISRREMAIIGKFR